MDQTYLDMFLQGGVIIIILAILSIISLAVIIERLVYIYRANVNMDSFFANLLNSVKSSDTDNAERLFKEDKYFLAPTIGKLKPGSSNLKYKKELAGEAITEAETNLKRRTHALIFIVQIAPLLGILGTVLGLAEAFLSIGNLGGAEKFQMLSSGIGKALSTTIAGLVIAAYTMSGHYLIKYRSGKSLKNLSRLIENYITAISENDAS